MSAALQPSLPPAALDLIKEGTPKPQTQIPTTTASPTGKVDEVAVSKQTVRPKIQRENNPVTAIVSLVPMTCRVPVEIQPALLKASSERKLKRLQPFTQQAIIAEALADWLLKNGYLPEKG